MITVNRQGNISRNSEPSFFGAMLQAQSCFAGLLRHWFGLERTRVTFNSRINCSRLAIFGYLPTKPVTNLHLRILAWMNPNCTDPAATSSFRNHSPLHLDSSLTPQRIWGSSDSFLTEVQPGLKNMAMELGDAAQLKDFTRIGSRMNHVAWNSWPWWPWPNGKIVVKHEKKESGYQEDTNHGVELGRCRTDGQFPCHV